MALIFVGCAGENQPQTPKKAVIEQVLNLPNQIEFEGKIFKKRFVTQNMAEYYIDGQSDYGYDELLTIFYLGNHNLSQFKNALENSLKNNSNKNKFKLKQMGEILLETSLFYPANDPKFSYFEANFSATYNEKCGLIQSRYAKNFDKSNNAENLWQNFKKKQNWFLKNYTKIICKEQK